MGRTTPYLFLYKYRTKCIYILYNMHLKLYLRNLGIVCFSYNFYYFTHFFIPIYMQSSSSSRSAVNCTVKRTFASAKLAHFVIQCFGSTLPVCRSTSLIVLTEWAEIDSVFPRLSFFVLLYRILNIQIHPIIARLFNFAVLISYKYIDIHV